MILLSLYSSRTIFQISSIFVLLGNLSKCRWHGSPRPFLSIKSYFLALHLIRRDEGPADFPSETRNCPTSWPLCIPCSLPFELEVPREQVFFFIDVSLTHISSRLRRQGIAAYEEYAWGSRSCYGKIEVNRWPGRARLRSSASDWRMRLTGQRVERSDLFLPWIFYLPHYCRSTQNGKGQITSRQTSLKLFQLWSDCCQNEGHMYFHGLWMKYKRRSVFRVLPFINNFEPYLSFQLSSLLLGGDQSYNLYNCAEVIGYIL